MVSREERQISPGAALLMKSEREIGYDKGWWTGSIFWFLNGVAFAIILMGYLAYHYPPPVCL